MAHLITLPAIVADATEAGIETWLADVGTEITAGQALADIETEKATVEFESEVAGTLARILVPAGTTVEVGTPIAVIAEAGDGEAEIAALLAGVGADAGATAREAGAAAATPATQSATAAGASAPVDGDIASPGSTGAAAGDARATDIAISSTTAAAESGDQSRIFASPLARRRARELGVDVAGLAGSGPGGRIIRADVEAAAARSGAATGGRADSADEATPVASATAAAPAASAPGTPAPASATAPTPASATAPTPASAEGPGYTDIPLTGMRRAIARRLTESKTSVPHFYLSGDVRMDALLDFRKQINASLSRQDVKATVNDLVLKALGRALELVPEANAIWNETSIRSFEAVDVSMAIATEGGLITPVVRDVTGLTMAELCRTTADFKVRAGQKRIKQHELEGGSFSLSNLGMFGTREFSAIINPPQAGILAVGATEQRAVVVDGELTAASMMTVTFSADHRVIDGAVAGRLLTALREALEDPLSLVL